MSTRVVDIEKPYEWGTAIEVTQDKVINLRLRSENNLIIYDEWDNEIYVDLQLPSDIEPADAIPVWINTGRVLAADWWDYTGTIVVFKTTSWDNIKLLYADNGRVFIDNWTGTFKEIYLKWDVDALIQGLRGYIDDELAKKQDKLTAWANITIQEDPQTHELVISSTGWGWASYTAWDWIDIDSNDVISLDSTYMRRYLPRSTMGNADTDADYWIYYWETNNWTATSALSLLTGQVAVKWDIDQYNFSRAYLEYYHNKADLCLRDVAWDSNSTTETNTEYHSDKIISEEKVWNQQAVTETFEFQWTWNDKIARLKDIPTVVNYTAWDNVQINNWVISATDTTYDAWEGIYIDNIPLLNSKWPAPIWFHIPSSTEWGALKSAFDWLSLSWTTSWCTYFKMPMAGYRSVVNSDVYSLGSDGRYWSCTRTTTSNASALYLAASVIHTNSWNSRAYGFSVRCFKDTPVIPDYSATSTWRQLYIWTSWWIFWDDVTWLISITSDWTNWITIADKNLWATTVYNYWDIVTDANCGYFYQWGNNYWFAHSWNVTTSSTQVDASTYWHWNYYSSSTFITITWRWDSTDNWNLWGWNNPTWVRWYYRPISLDTSTVVLKWSNIVNPNGYISLEDEFNTSSIKMDLSTYNPYLSIESWVNMDNIVLNSRWIVYRGTETYSFMPLSWVNEVVRKKDLSVVSWDANTYSIVVSNSAPASWTPNTTLTFVV
jgi:hypothetical protein